MSAAPSVPFLDLKAQHAVLKPQILSVVNDIVDTAQFILGPHVAQFEEDFAEYVEAEHCVAVGSGTAALHLALIAAGVKPGDEVITAAMTFVATCWAISYVGARPVLVDVDPTTYTIDVGQVAAAITARTKAIVPVHLYGQPADLVPLIDLANEHGVVVVEDAAQAHGGVYGERRVGTHGVAGCFSFYPGKNLGAVGEGGAVVTNDASLADHMRSLRNHSQRERYRHFELGFNYRMDSIQGAILGLKLPHLETWIEQRRLLAARYNDSLEGLRLTLPREVEGRRHVWHLYVVLLEERDSVGRSLAAANVGFGLHYPIPVHLQEAYKHLGHHRGDFPVAERIAEECLSLPLYPQLAEREQEYVIEVLGESIV